MLAFAINDGGAHGVGQVLEQIAQRKDEAIVECVALGAAGEANDGNFLLLATAFEMKILVAHSVYP